MLAVRKVELKLEDQALGQCKRYIATHYPSAGIHGVNSTALAASMLGENSTFLAISSLHCAQVYNLEVVDTEIQDGEGEYRLCKIWRCS